MLCSCVCVCGCFHRVKERLVSLRGVVVEHSYRIDCDTTRLSSWEPSTPLVSPSAAPTAASGPVLRHIVALRIRGLHSPDTVMAYLKFNSRELLSLGLLPGAVVSFHSFSLKSSRAGNTYCINNSSSSITVESLAGVSNTNSPLLQLQTGPTPTPEMLNLPVSSLYDLTQALLQGRLSRRVVCVKARVMSVQQASVQFKCQSCQCVAVDGHCMSACLLKKPVLVADTRFDIQPSYDVPLYTPV